jgi:GT2 family glycosyltransferase
MRTPGPVWVGQVELGKSLLPIGAIRERRSEDVSARLLVRLHGQVLGFASLPLSAAQISSQAVAAAVCTQLASPLGRHFEADELTSCHERAAASAPNITVVVCTRDRPAMLGTCLESLRKLAYGPFEVIIVDNAPATEAAQDCFNRTVGDDTRFRYVREAKPGLSRARNRGMAEATTRYVAFTDDDVRVDRSWLQAVAAGFARDRLAGCVTGLVVPAELDHPSQLYFDRRFSWASRVDRRVYSFTSRDGLSALYPYSAGLFGTGANFAVDRELMEDLGGFDEALGAGSPARGGEELDAFVRVLRAGRTVVYEPSGVVWHAHRADPRALRRQLFAYGEGLTAFLTKYLLDGGTTREILHRVPEGARQVAKMWRPAAMNGGAPASLVLAEILGMVAGPFAYLRGRRLALPVTHASHAPKTANAQAVA